MQTEKAFQRQVGISRGYVCCCMLHILILIMIVPSERSESEVGRDCRGRRRLPDRFAVQLSYLWIERFFYFKCSEIDVMTTIFPPIADTRRPVARELRFQERLVIGGTKM